MVAYFDTLSPSLESWALAQSVFFTASAPLSGQHINLSPKGLPSTTFAVLSPTTAAYLDATGSGNETISHLYENGRITIMFCSFDATPRILRLFCTGEVVEWDQPEFGELLGKMGKKRIDGGRAIISLKIWKVQTSCGYAVPRLAKGDGIGEFEDRETLGHFAKQKVEKNEMSLYQQKNNVRSLDGLPGLRAARRDNGEILWAGDVAAVFRRIARQREAVAVGFCLGLMVWLITVLMQRLSMLK